MSRINNSFKNISVGMIGQVTNTLFSFINRTIFLYTLGITYSSINSFFLNVVSVLSLAELGIGEAIIYNLYKPIAENDKGKIKALMNYYKKTYRLIGLSVLTLGVMFTPFLSFLVKESKEIEKFYIYYFIVLGSSAISYFYSYKGSLLIAHQQGFIKSKYILIFNSLKSIIQIFVLLIWNNFLYYLLIHFICTFLADYIIGKKVELKYEYIKNNKNYLSKNEIKVLNTNVKSLAIYKFGNVLIDNIDNFVIVNFIGLKWIGYISNYLLIYTSARSILGNVFTGITASLGNLVSQETKEKQYFLFRTISLLNFWIFSFFSITIFKFSDVFISVWIGKEYILDTSLVFLITLNFYISGFEYVITLFRNTTGIFNKTRYIFILGAVLNLIFSLIGVNLIGIEGIFLATIIAKLCTNLWYEPFVLFSYFQIQFKEYIYLFLKYILILAIDCLLIEFFLKNNVIVYLEFIIVILIPNIVFLVFWGKSKEFKYLFMKIKSLYRK
ncbi:MAG: lipopolysaccharide biosynthesis protein [Sarcina sp.]